jgi:hypothetical protein
VIHERETFHRREKKVAKGKYCQFQADRKGNRRCTPMHADEAARFRQKERGRLEKR